MQEETKFTTTTDGRTFYFNTRKTANNKPYLVITEVKEAYNGSRLERRAMVIFEKDIPAFTAAFLKAIITLTR